MKTLSLLPNIEEWISSEKITHLIMGLNTSYKISSGIIAGLVYDLVIKKTAPENLVIELNKKINFDSKRLGVLVAEIKEKLLKPIEVPLRQDLQIDIQKIVIPVAPIQPEKAEIEKQELMQKPQQAPQKLREVPSFSSEQTPPPQKTLPRIPTVRPNQPPPVDLRGKKPLEPKPVNDEPLILHHESIPVSLPQTPPATKQTPKTQNQKSAERVVHYSGPVTSIE